jgi:hypothetical protein
MLRSRIAVVVALTGLATTTACRSQPVTGGTTTITSVDTERVSVGAHPPGDVDRAAAVGADTRGPPVQVAPVVIAPIAVPQVVVTPVGVDAAAPQPRQDASVEPPTATTTPQLETSLPIRSPATVLASFPAPLWASQPTRPAWL